MKDYERQVTYESLKNFVNHAIEKDYQVDVIEGVLNDTFIIFNPDRKLSIKGVKARKYIVLYPKFYNAWSNTFHILMTDDDNKVDEFLKSEEI
jgi:hypothetical protein